jgi:hypothetical protein
MLLYINLFSELAPAYDDEERYLKRDVFRTNVLERLTLEASSVTPVGDSFFTELASAIPPGYHE